MALQLGLYAPGLHIGQEWTMAATGFCYATIYFTIMSNAFWEFFVVDSILWNSLWELLEY